MAKTTEEYQQEMAQLLVHAGEAQFMSRMYKKLIEEQNNKLNTFNQKIEKIKQEMFSNLSKAGQETVLQQPQQVEVSDAVAPAEDLPTAS